MSKTSPYTHLGLRTYLSVAAVSFVSVLGAVPVSMSLSSTQAGAQSRSSQSSLADAEYQRFAYAFNAGFQTGARANTTNNVTGMDDGRAPAPCEATQASTSSGGYGSRKWSEGGSGQDAHNVSLRYPGKSDGGNRLTNSHHDGELGYGRYGGNGSQPMMETTHGTINNSYDTYSYVRNETVTTNSNNMIGSNNETMTDVQAEGSTGLSVGVSSNTQAQNSMSTGDRSDATNKADNRSPVKNDTSTEITTEIDDSYNQKTTNRADIDDSFNQIETSTDASNSGNSTTTTANTTTNNTDNSTMIRGDENEVGNETGSSVSNRTTTDTVSAPSTGTAVSL